MAIQIYRDWHMQPEDPIRPTPWSRAGSLKGAHESSHNNKGDSSGHALLPSTHPHCPSGDQSP